MTISADHSAPDQAQRLPAEDAVSEAVRKFGITVEDYMLPARHQIQMVDPEGRLKAEGEQGTEPGHEYPLPADEELLAAYEQLVVGRRVNDQNSALVRQGRMAVYPSIHGQEACQVSAALCLAEGDWMFPTYRDAVAVMARGVDPVETMTIFWGDWLALRCGTSARILARAGMPRLWDLDPVTGARIRAARATHRRYERHAPGDMIHVDVKKLGRIPDGGGWRADPSQNLANHRTSHQKLGFDYVHVAVNDYTRFAYAEVLPDEKGPTCAGFLIRAAAAMATNGAPVKRVMTDNALGYRLSRDFQNALAALGAKHILIKPRHPWQNGKAERFNRTLQEGWAFRQPLTSNQARTDALQHG